MQSKTFLVLIFTLVLIAQVNIVKSQNIDIKLEKVSKEITDIQQKEDSLLIVFEELKLTKVKNIINEIIVPELEKDEKVTEHKAYCLVYDEKHEQAKWVAHIIPTEIITGNNTRSNDFRVDSLISTGSTCDDDYFIATLQKDSTYIYDGFGYDRGHLAPSADFKWSKEALSESYFYSNMSPMKPEFNRGGWSLLEDLLRTYVIENNVDLYVVTGPVLNDSLAIIERSINKVSIPEYFFKIAYDPTNSRAIAFLMPNTEILYPTEYYAVKIDSVENITGINFFPNLADEIENSIENMDDYSSWLNEKQQNDVSPIKRINLAANTYNTVQAKEFMGQNKRVTVCGTVVGAYTSKNGHTFLNLDKSFPNHIFTATIFSANKINFSYDPEDALYGKKICVTGKITEYNGTPSMSVENEKSVEIIE